MDKKLNGKKVAVLLDHGFEQIEMTKPVAALKDQGASIFIISRHDRVKGWEHVKWGAEFKTDVLLDKALPTQYDALLLPGGVMNPDKLRMDPKAVSFVKHFMESGKPIAAICHGPWTLIETGMIRGRKVTSWPSIKTDLMNAGANWTDEEVVVDNGLVTSRKPDDIPAFNKKMIEEFSEGIHKSRTQPGNQKPPVKRDNNNRLNENIDTRNLESVEDRRDPKSDF
jgi:protease I